MNDKEKLISLLKSHDWSYYYSDDHSAYTRGAKEADDIKALVKKLGEEGQKLYDEYKSLKESKPLDDNTVEKSDSIMQDLKGNKREFVKRYGKDAEKVMKGRSIQMAKKKMTETKIKDAIKEVLSEVDGSPYKDRETVKNEFKEFLATNGATVRDWSEGELFIELPKPYEGFNFRVRIYL